MRFNKIFLVLVAVIIAIGVYQFTSTPSGRPSVNSETADATAAINKVIQQGQQAANTGIDASAKAANDAVAAAMQKVSQSANTALVSQPDSTIVQILSSNAQFQTFSRLLETANLTATLNGTGPFTIFAPNDAAFAAMPADTLASLQTPGNGEALNKFLGQYIANTAALDLSGQTQISSTLAGTSLQISSVGSSARVNGATVTGTPVMASNGVIHTIDSVFAAPSAETPTN